MAVEAITTLSSVVQASSQADAGGQTVSKAAPNASQSIEFNSAMQHANSITNSNTPMNSPVKGLFDALDQVNVQARSVSDYASMAEASGGQLTPGEIVQLTMKCQEFMFQCQLTSNIANRSSDGVQQLFRQQG